MPDGEPVRHDHIAETSTDVFDFGAEEVEPEQLPTAVDDIPDPGSSDADGSRDPDVDDLDTPTIDPPPWATMERQLASIAEELTESQRLIARQTDIAAALHAENQALRNGELKRAQSSLVLNVLAVFDDVRQMAETTTGDRRRDLDMIADSLVEALDRNGIETDEPEPGTKFSSARHRVGIVTPTGDAELDRTVASTLRPGFVWADGTVVRSAQVVVHKYTVPPTELATDAPVPDEEHLGDDPAATPLAADPGSPDSN